ncbi:UNVERIFIED_CONTAM: hypothetical protein RMT77_001351 [Armadillidium vulgare]
MIGRIILKEKNFNLTKKTRLLFSYPCYTAFKYSLYPALNKEDKSISKHVRGPTPTIGKKAKEATKTTYYTAVVVAGIGAFGLMMYAIFKELISSFSPQAVYSAAVDKISSDPRVVDMFGANIKCFGETSRRGRRQHITNLPYELEGKKGFRIRFYLQGQYRSGTVNLDARESSSGWDFRYLFVQTDSYPHQVIVVEDNRSVIDTENASEPSQFPLSLQDS